MASVRRLIFLLSRAAADKTQGGLLYPMSLQAAAVLDIFQLALEDRNVPVYLKNKVVDVTASADHSRFTIKCLTETEEEVVYTSDYLLLSTGATPVPMQEKNLRVIPLPNVWGTP